MPQGLNKQTPNVLANPGQAPILSSSNPSTGSSIPEGSLQNSPLTPQGAATQLNAGNHKNSSMIPVTTASSIAPSAGCDDLQSTITMANTKEKTPMCLINELARFNKVQHQYRLVDESGPAHKKTFTVVLKLDSEEYTASGPSIKKAQHTAAAIALDKTNLKHPVPKLQHKTLGPITPTVELNALAMKRGELAVYQTIDAPRPPYIPNFNFRGMYNQRYHYPKLPPTYCVALKVGNRQFFGEGRTAQAARHAAAEEALRVLRDVPVPEAAKKRNEAIQQQVQQQQVQQQVQQQISVKEEKAVSNGTTKNDNSDDEEDLKSPISLVHEIALKHVLSVNFEVIRESGPPHMRNFVTKCSVGEFSTEGEGNGKKVSKKRAAEKMMEELKKLPPLPVTPPKVKKKPVIKKKSQNLIKEQKADPQYGQGINPISRLIQIQQAKKDREPVYTVIAERGEPRQREFVMQCALGDLITPGYGPNKKTAKRNAAEGMLQLLGYSRPPPLSAKGQKNTGNEEHISRIQEAMEKPRKVTFLEHENEKPDTEGKLGRQLVPGLLLMPDANLSGQGSVQGFGAISSLNRAPGGPIQSQDVCSKIPLQTTSAIAKELLDSGVSPTAETYRQSVKSTTGPQNSVHPKQQLLYLAEVLGFQVHFTDFPKGNKLDYLSLVSLSTNPPQVSHGAGPTIEASHDQAALTALRALAELGLDSVTDKDKKEIASGGLSNGMKLSGGPKLANSSATPDLGGNLKTGASVTAKDGH